MKKTYFLSKITTFILCFILLAGTTTAFAAGKQLMSYNGTGIMAKASVSNFTLSELLNIAIPEIQKPAKAVLDLKKVIQNPRGHIDYIFLHTNMLIR